MFPGENQIVQVCHILNSGQNYEEQLFKIQPHRVTQTKLVFSSTTRTTQGSLISETQACSMY